MYKGENSYKMDRREDTMNEKGEREEKDPLNNVYTLEHPGECAELRLIVDIKPRKDAESMLSVRAGFRERTH